MAIHPLVAFKRHYARSLLRLEGVLGVGVGRESLDRPHSRLSLILYIEAPALVQRLRALPQIRALIGELTARGWSLRMVTTGPLVSTGSVADFRQQAVALRQRLASVHAGASIGTRDPDSTGTAGLVVQDASGAPLLLGNAHVLNTRNSTATAEVLQPGPADIDGGGDPIGALHRSMKLRQTHCNYLDAAVVRLDSAPSGYVPEVLAVQGYCNNYGVGTCAVKVGRTTGVVRGRVQATDADLLVSFTLDGKLDGKERRLLFVNQTVFEATGAETDDPNIQDHGDSGAVWVAEDSRLACAISFAANADGTLSMASPFVWAAQVFELTVPPLGGVDVPSQGQGDASDLPVEPLDAQQVLDLRRLIMEAGTSWEAPEMDDDDGAWIQHRSIPKIDRDRIYFGHGTQLSGGSTGFRGYTVLGVESGGSSHIIARVVAVGGPPTSEQPFAASFPEVGEYWFFTPSETIWLLRDLSHLVFKRSDCHATWHENDNFLNTTLGMSLQATPSLLNIQTTSWCQLSATQSGSIVAWGGTLNSEPFALAFDVYPTAYTNNIASQAVVTCVRWYRTPTNGTIAPLFDMPCSQGDIAVSISKRTLQDTANVTWTSWPPTRS